MSAGGVNQNADFHAAPDGGAQSLDKGHAVCIVVKDICRKADAFGGVMDGGQHGRIRGIAVDQSLHFVAGDQRLAHDAFDSFRQLPQVNGVGMQADGIRRICWGIGPESAG